MATLVDRIRATRDILKGGFCKGQAERSSPLTGQVSHCTVGAACLAVSGVTASPAMLHFAYRDKYNEASDVVTHLSSYLPEDFEPHCRPWRRVVDYNNRPETTQQDVVNLCEKALADLGGMDQ